MRPLAALLLSLACSRADLVLVQQVEGGGQSGKQTIRIKGGQSRADLADSMSLITDGASGDAFALRHADKTFVKISPAQGKALLEQFAKRRGNAPPPALKPAGKTEKVGDYDCDIFTCDLGGLTVTYWLAKNFPDYAVIQEQLAAVQSGALALGTQGLLPDPKKFPGMTMKTEMDLGGKKVATTTVSVKQEAVDPYLFKVPGNYKETPLIEPKPAEK